MFPHEMLAYLNFFFLQQHGYAGAPFYLYGNGLCLSWDETTQMEHTLEDTWELTLTYTQTTGGYG